MLIQDGSLIINPEQLELTASVLQVSTDKLRRALLHRTGELLMISVRSVTNGVQNKSRRRENVMKKHTEREGESPRDKDTKERKRGHGELRNGQGE